MSYSATEKHYDSTINVKRLSIRYRDFHPLEGDLDLHFLFRPAQLELKTLNFRTQHSQLQAEGTVNNYNSPEVHVQYNASLDLAEAGQNARTQQLQAGRLELKGVGSYLNRRYAAQGNLAVHGMA